MFVQQFVIVIFFQMVTQINTLEIMMTNRVSTKPFYGKLLKYNYWRDVQLLESLKKRFESPRPKQPIPLQRSMALGGKVPDKKSWWNICMYPNNEKHLVYDR